MTPFLVLLVQFFLDFSIGLFTVIYGFMDAVSEKNRVFTILEVDKGRIKIAGHDNFFVC